MGSSSPASLPWDTRLRIAKGVARGLGYLHEKKHVHGNVKPSNILLGSDMEAMLGDYGLERLLISGESSSKAGGSSRHLGSKRSTLSQGSLPDASTASPAQSSTAAASPYLAPESLKNLKPSPKWDVYSFGIILLELLTGRAFTDRELLQWNNPVFAGEDRNRALRTVDCGLRGEVSDAKEEALLACFRLGLSCAAVSPQRRPSMKEAVQILDKVPSSSNSNKHLLLKL